MNPNVSDDGRALDYGGPHGKHSLGASFPYGASGHPGKTLDTGRRAGLRQSRRCTLMCGVSAAPVMPRAHPCR